MVSIESTPERHICGECARFKVPNSGCPWAEDVRQGTIRTNDKACGEFYPRHKGDKEKKGKKQLKDSGYTVNGCFEAVYVDEKPCFLVKNSENFAIVESVEVNGEKFFPKGTKNIPYRPYGFFEGPVPNREELFYKIRDQFEIFIDVEPIWKDVLSACVLLSYHQEKLQTVPYIFLYGDNESGKSTVLQLLKFLCYRPMYGVTIPSADLYGYLEDTDSVGCILEDEVQGIQKDTDKIKIYKAGYKEGAVVPRTLMPQFDRIIKYYRTFCFKACAGEQIPQVKGFNERFLFIPMVEGFPQKEWADTTKEDLKRLYDLRNMLLKWRLLSKDWQLPEVQMPMKGRVKELWKPLLQITHDLTVYDGLFKFVEDQRTERLNTKQNTLEGHIVKVVIDIHNQAKDTVDFIPFKTVWDELRLDLDGKIDERKPNVMDTSEFFDITKNKIGYRLREVLSGKTAVRREKDSEGNWVSSKVYVFDSEKLKRIARKYGYELVTKLLTLPSFGGVQASTNSEKTVQSMENPSVFHENNVDETVVSQEKKPRILQELGKLSNSVTSETRKIEESSSENPREKSTVGKSVSNSVTSVQEALESVRSRFVEGTQAEWISFAVDAGLSREEAEALFQRLKGSEMFWYDRPEDGKTVWRWA